MPAKPTLLLSLVVLLAGCSANRTLTRQELSNLQEIEVIVGFEGHKPSFVDIPKPQVSSPAPSNSKYEAVRIVDATLSAIAEGQKVAAYSTRHMTLSEHYWRLQRAVDGYDFQPDMLEAAKQQLATVTSVRIEVRPTAFIGYRSSEALKRVAYDRSIARAVLFLFVSSNLQDEGGQPKLGVWATAEMFAKGNATKASPVTANNALYSKQFGYQFPYNSLSNVQQIYKNAAQSLASQLAADLNKP